MFLSFKNGIRHHSPGNWVDREICWIGNGQVEWLKNLGDKSFVEKFDQIANYADLNSQELIDLSYIGECEFCPKSQIKGINYGLGRSR
jgi:hypothetical protein